MKREKPREKQKISVYVYKMKIILNLSFRKFEILRPPCVIEPGANKSAGV